MKAATPSSKAYLRRGTTRLLTLYQQARAHRSLLTALAGVPAVVADSADVHSGFLRFLQPV